MEFTAMIANNKTGEVCSTDSAKGLKFLRGKIREWSNEGMNIHDFGILEWSNDKLYFHLRDYAWCKSHHECDICQKVIKYEDTKWCDDNEGVCVLAGCRDCLGN